MPVSFRKSSWSHFHCVWKDSCWFWISSKTHLKHSKTNLLVPSFWTHLAITTPILLTSKKRQKTGCEQKKILEQKKTHQTKASYRRWPNLSWHHPGRLTWNLQITHLERKIILQTSVIMFHVNLPGCICLNLDTILPILNIRNDTLVQTGQGIQMPLKSPCTHWETLMLQENPPRALTFSTLLNTELSSVFNIMFNCVCVVWWRWWILSHVHIWHESQHNTF